MKEILKKIRIACPDIAIRTDVNMGEYTSFRAGGTCSALILVGTVEELKTVLSLVKDVKHMVLGNGTNTLFKEGNYDGIVIKLGDSPRFSFAATDVIGEGTERAKAILEAYDTASKQPGFDTNKNPKPEFHPVGTENENEWIAGSSMLLSVFAKILAENSVKGFEFASGIPGSIGGAIFMNAGAYGGEMKDIVKWVRAVSPDGEEERIFTNEEMNFGYRHTLLQDNNYIVTDVCFSLEKGDRDEIYAEMKELAHKRNSKQPVQYPSAGSTFKRPEGNFAGKLIEDAGLKGVSVGGAEVSTLHAGFIINKGNATPKDITDLISLVQNVVYDKFGVMLEPEVRII